MGTVTELKRWCLSKVLQAEEEEISKQTCEASMICLEKHKGPNWCQGNSKRVRMASEVRGDACSH